MIKKSCSTCRHFDAKDNLCNWMFSNYGKLPEWFWYKAELVPPDGGEYCFTWRQIVDKDTT